MGRRLIDGERWKRLAKRTDEGYFELATEDTGHVPVRLFLTRDLLLEAEDILYRQIVNATRFPGVRLVVITPDTHYGYGVPVGCVILTEAASGAVAMGPVGFDIGCFAGDTLISLVDGRSYPIEELAQSGDSVFVHSKAPDGRTVASEAAVRKTRVDAPLVKVTLGNGREIRCTPDHEFMLRTGEYREARDLRPGTRLMPFASAVANDAVEVGGVEHLGVREDVYCLTVPEYGNFALDAGAFVHNCGMMSARSEVPAEAATPDRRLEFNRAVMERVEMGAGGGSRALGSVSKPEFEELVRGGAEHYVERYGASFDRSRAERHRIPVDDDWRIPWGGRGRPERGLGQLGSLGGGNHFIELQRSEQTGTLFVQVHTGSRGFGHGLATNYFELARAERPEETKEIDLGYFMPDSPHYRDYLNAVAAGGNFAILNRLVIYEQIAKAFRKVFRADLELVYEISHNLVQRERHPEFGDVLVHRKGATRAFPAGHPALEGTIWEDEGHPVLIPGSNMDYSFILRPLAGAVRSGYSVNHGAGRRLSRGDATRQLSQSRIDREYREAGILVNIDGRVPLDEAAPAYKSSVEVIRAVTEAKLAKIEHRLWPLSSLKGTESRGRRGRGKPDRKANRRATRGGSDHY